MVAVLLAVPDVPAVLDVPALERAREFLAGVRDEAVALDFTAGLAASLLEVRTDCFERAFTVRPFADFDLSDGF